MLSFDLVDSVLEIGDSESNNGLFDVRFKDFYSRHFGSQVDSARLVYMFYSAILTLPLTPKLTEHGIDGLLVAKKGENLKLIASYATNDNSLSLKFIRVDCSMPFAKFIVENSLISDAQKLLSKVKGRQVAFDELKSALTEIYNVVFEYEPNQSPVTMKPKISKIPYSIEQASLRSSNSHGFKLVRQSKHAKAASLFVKGLQSDVYGVVKYNSHSLARLLMMYHQKLAKIMQLSPAMNDMYVFLIGALEMNWARMYHLNIHPIIEPSSTFISSLIINYTPQKKTWQPEPVRFIIQLLKSNLPSYHTNYVENMYHSMASKVPDVDSEVTVIGIEHKKLIDGPTDIEALKTLPFTFLLDLNPMENIVDLFLRDLDQTTMYRLDYCIEKLNAMGKFGLHAYLYGQLITYSKHDLEKYVYHGGIMQGLTNFAFKVRGSETGILFDIYQTSNYEYEPLPRDRITPIENLNVKRLIRITVYQMYTAIDNTQLVKAHLIKSEVQILNEAALQRQVNVDADWWPIPNDVNPDKVLVDMERRAEVFQELEVSDKLHILLDSIDENLLRFQNSMSFKDILHFMSGLFSDYKKISYHGLLGILKSDGTPFFLSTIYTIPGDEENQARETLREITAKYTRFDYFGNPSRRRANFVCITRTAEDRNRFGIARISTFEEHKAAFESCLATRWKRDSQCIAEEFSQQIDNEKLPFVSKEFEDAGQFRPMKIVKSKIQLPLKTLNKVSKVIMTAQIFKDMVGALIRGDYKTFVVNTAFLASGPLLECLSMKMVAKGTSMGGSLLGRSLIISAPFLGRLPFMGFIGYDLYEQVKAYKNGTKDAMVNIAADSTILTIDFATASVEAAEALGLISGVADTFGPIGFAIGTAIFVGADIYTSVKTVSKIDAMVQLTGWQKFTTGFFSFLHVSPTKTVQKEIFEKTAADTSVDNAANFFKNYPSVKYYVFPSYKEDGQFVENNIIDLTTNVTKMAHSWPKSVANTKLICSSNSELRVERTSRLLLNCSNSFGYESDSKDDKAVIFLANGNDTVKTFKERSTTFLIENGNKSIIGSSQDDLFILNGNDTVGYINGWSGKNVLNLANFAPSYPVRINLVYNQLIYSSGKIKIHNIHSVIGRAMVQDTVICDCSTEYVDTQGGSTFSLDTIFLRRICPYDITIKINGTIIIKNRAVGGRFKYIISKNHEAIISNNLAVNTTSRFIFEHDLEDVELVEMISLDNISLYHNITFKSNSSQLKLGNINQNAVYIFRDYSEMRINNGTVSINVISNDTIDNILQKYVLLSEKFSAVMKVFATLKNTSILFGNGMAIHHGDSNDFSNHINIMSNDPDRETYLVGGKNQNVFRISIPELHKTATCDLKQNPPVKIMNYAENEFVNVIDLYEIVLLIQEQFSGRVSVGIKAENSDLIMSVYAQCQGSAMTNIINVTLHKALENENYGNIAVNMRRPMTIRQSNESIYLVPADYKLPNATHTVIHSGLVEPFTTVVSPRKLGKYDIVVFNRTNLILTNLKYVEEENDLILIILKEFFISDELRTLRLKFLDQVVNLNDELEASVQD